MRIAYVTAGLPHAHSREDFFLPEILCLMEMGHDLRIIPRNIKGPLSPDVPPSVLARSLPRGLLAPEVLLAFFQLLLSRPWRIWTLARTACLDPSRANTLRNLLVLPKGVWLAKVARRLDAQLIYVQWGSTPATIGQVAHLLTGIPWCLTLHRGDIAQNNRLLDKLRSAVFTRFISESGIRLLRQVTDHHGPLPGRALVMHMGVRVPVAESLRPLGPAQPFTLLCPASFYPVKGHIHLLAALPLLRERGIEVRLLLAGIGQLRPGLEAWLREHGEAGRVSFLGHLSQEALFERYRSGQVHAVVLPSIDCGAGVHEGIPVSLMEAMAHALPVVSTRTGGIPELLGDGAGLLVPDRDPEALADAIARLAADPRFAAATGARGRERVLDAFNIEEIAQRLQALAAP